MITIDTAFNNPQDFGIVTPTQRHGGKFNAGYLDGHAEPATWAEDYTPRHFVAGSVGTRT
jgi:prepilin-type processing-associated H-X9-DG protein